MSPSWLAREWLANVMTNGEVVVLSGDVNSRPVENNAEYQRRRRRREQQSDDLATQLLFAQLKAQTRRTSEGSDD